MRLKRIRLAGFKSFVDPTTIQLPGRLIGIVGPNGCGKSNVIDAVRWVMGESSAKTLRGDSMADVIFNGSTSRKPVGQASVELVFDNADGGLGGQYARFAEISIRRTVTRDGQSAYYLNGTRCRRRDIMDVFLGTGLGPRSYSIIEQGMISRLIEARPEELRAYLEEAAGISRYKERRRETETRIRQTRENLERLQDLREEIGRRLEQLQRQARAAERYRALRAEARRLEARLWLVRRRRLQEALGALEARIGAAETAVEAAAADLRGIEARLDRAREAREGAAERFGAEQGRYYAHGAEVARLEQGLAHQRELAARLARELEEARSALAEARGHMEADRARLEALGGEIEAAVPAVEAARARAEQAAERLREAEARLAAWRRRREEQQQALHEARRAAEVERTRIQHLDRDLERLARRQAAAEEERAALDGGPLQAEIARLTEEGARLREVLATAEARLEESGRGLAAARRRGDEAAEALHRARSELQRLRGRLASLEALQQAALGRGDGAVRGWVERAGLAEAPRLAEALEVDPGWEQAVETVLGPALEAVCVEAVERFAEAAAALEGGHLTLVEPAEAAAGGARAGLEPLAARVRGGHAAELLAGILAAPDLATALAARAALAPGESVVTADGIWLGRGWLRVARARDERSGVLAREREIRSLRAEVSQAEARVAALEGEVAEAAAAVRTLEEAREEAARARHEAQRALARVEAELGGRRARLEHVEGRRARLEAELAELAAQRERDEVAVREARGRLEAALGHLATLEAQQREIEAQRRGLEEAVAEARERARGEREQAHGLEVRLEAQRAEEASTRRNLERAEARAGQLGQRQEALEAALREAEAPIEDLARRLEAALAARVEVEQALGQARQALEAVEAEIRELESARGEAERRLQARRDAVAALRAEREGLAARLQGVDEQLARLDGVDLEAEAAALAPQEDEAACAEALTAVEERIRRLGPVNLAAIEEHAQQEERKRYLDAQHEDLTTSLQTLEAAIRRIDRETRERFRDTFDRVNASLQALFPRLFGGGHAYLQMTGEDLLDTGVTVMARPPGKRISNIHLLSGGEKALTAVALVFAIFELNPSPFCMLDEVDAPLDEANVGRYCELVREMSERVQFIIITHNKTTMEIAEQLIGVTMNEPGVSRLVAVDVEDAVQMAAG
ncbi:chromosome segregation protein SMC [Inmirania thermothiophila]|uniref:Chromosome partition protein Smc n=1 Tax=Inmirania thermothiophila TaxID=1750597 RepID=A0A3N1Y138_9GAMM|nr:chromosome segregation protein SMC [Inmirania thermothiophila]ROR32251.1 condensin subunit Smc [Inmirania thermothiophila]